MIEFFVAGVPVGQGSKRAFVNKHTGRASIVDNNKSSLTKWRGYIHDAAEDCISTLYLDAVAVDATFVFVRPKSVSAKKRPAPTVSPDLDKLLRALLDGLTGVAFTDDDQVTECHVSKRYGALGEQPGVHVIVGDPSELIAAKLCSMRDGYRSIASVRDQEALPW